MSATGQELGANMSDGSTSSDVSSSESNSPLPPPGGSNSSVAHPSGNNLYLSNLININNLFEERTKSLTYHVFPLNNLK